jgi:RHH-type rel operon transcriptional repressor/antitoxin RelB
MNTDTFSVRLDRSAKRRFQKLAKSTGLSRAFLAAEAIHEYLDVNEWQVAGIKHAMGGARPWQRDRPQERERMGRFLGGRKERPSPKGV